MLAPDTLLNKIVIRELLWSQVYVVEYILYDISVHFENKFTKLE